MCELYPIFKSCCGVSVRVAMVYIAILSIVTGAMINAMLKKAGVNVASIQDVKNLNKNSSRVKYEETIKSLEDDEDDETTEEYTDEETESDKDVDHGHTSHPVPTETKPPPTDAKPPPTEAKPPPTEAKPPPTTAKPPPTEAKPPPTTAKPPSTEAKPTPTEAKPPPTEATPPPTEAKPPPTEAKPPPTDAKPPQTSAKPPQTTTDTDDEHEDESETESDETTATTGVTTTTGKPFNFQDLLDQLSALNRKGLNLLSCTFVALGVLLLVANFTKSAELTLLYVAFSVTAAAAAAALLLGVAANCARSKDSCLLRDMDFFSSFVVSLFWFIYIFVWLFFAGVANAFANGVY